MTIVEEHIKALRAIAAMALDELYKHGPEHVSGAMGDMVNLAYKSAPAGRKDPYFERTIELVAEFGKQLKTACETASPRDWTVEEILRREG